MLLFECDNTNIEPIDGRNKEMMREEFDNILRKQFKFADEQINAISNADYKKIEYVYTYHPAIDAVDGKHQIAYLYANFGMVIISDMEETASLAEDLEDEIRETENKLKELRDNYELLKKGEKYYARTDQN